MHQVGHLQGKTDAQSINQQVRWINTKEEHASKIIAVVSEYFMTQKLKGIPAKSDTAAYAAYLEVLAAHHAVLVAAMKTKQTVDDAAAVALLKAIEEMIIAGKYSNEAN